MVKRHLFISGPAFSGKSRLIRECLGERMRYAGGFCTELSSAPDGGLLGCSMLPTAMAAGEEGFEKELFIDLRKTPVGHDNEVFRHTGVRLLEESLYYPFAVRDEIGGMVLIIPQFRVSLDALLVTQLPILGVVKSLEESENLRQMLGPGERFHEFSLRLHQMLDMNENTEVLRFEGDAAEACGDAVREWVETWTAGGWQ